MGSGQGTEISGQKADYSHGAEIILKLEKEPGSVLFAVHLIADC